MSRNLVGVTLGKYRCDEFIGLGGMAEVYRAVDTELDRVVALKVLHPFFVSEDGFMERFRREARTLAALQHPNIVQIYDSGLQDFNSYVVMEYVPGSTLKDRLRGLTARGERMPIVEVRRILDALCSALRYAHGAGIVHRDLKPTNVILAGDGRVVLTDFGLAKIVGSTVHTASMAMIGTPAYMPPEQAKAGAVDTRSDIYSLGVILFELLTGQLPFEADTPFAMIAKHTQESLPRLSALRRDLPRGLERVLLKATAKDPADRFQSVDQFAAALNAAFDGRRIPFVSMRPRLSRLSRGAGAWVTLAAIGLLVLGAGTAGGWFEGAVPSPTPTMTPTFTPTPTPSPTPNPLLARIIGMTALFERPNESSRIITRLPNGTDVEVLARQGLWWQVRALDNSLEGWVMVDHLDFVPTPTPTLTPPPGDTLTPTPTRTPSPRSTPGSSPTPTSDDQPGGTQPPADTPGPGSTPPTIAPPATTPRPTTPPTTAPPATTPPPSTTQPPPTTARPPTTAPAPTTPAPTPTRPIPPCGPDC